MGPQRIFFDANAGAPMLPQARDAVVAALDDVANASSVHAEGRRARQRIEAARQSVAALVGAAPETVIFTAGATEAAAHALSPLIRHGRGTRRISRLYVGATEHPCVLAGGRFRSDEVTLLPVLSTGVVDLQALEAMLAAHDAGAGAPCVALMLANNETGVVHPVAEAARLVRRYAGYLFCDAVQAAGRMPVDIEALGADFLALSSHKLGGPQGAGALVLADEGVRPEPLLRGGGQERRHRAGTENVTALSGFGVAAERARHHVEEAGRVALLRRRLEEGLRAAVPEAEIVGEAADRIPNTTLFMAPGIAAETAVIAFDLAGVAVSAGSACSSGKVAESHVLAAMGRAGASGVRVSLPFDATEDEVDRFLAIWRDVHRRLLPGRAA